MIGVLLFLAIPVVWVIVLSFLNYNLASPASWAGVQNYINMFKFDGAAHSSGSHGLLRAFEHPGADHLGPRAWP